MKVISFLFFSFFFLSFYNFHFLKKFWCYSLRILTYSKLICRLLPLHSPLVVDLMLLQILLLQGLILPTLLLQFLLPWLCWKFLLASVVPFLLYCRHFLVYYLGSHQRYWTNIVAVLLIISWCYIVCCHRVKSMLSFGIVLFFLVLHKYCFKIHSMYFPLHHNFQEKLFRPVKKFMTKNTGAFVGRPPKSKT